jgi:mRNA interferase MazF
MTGPFQWQLVQADLDPAIGSEQAGTRPFLIISWERPNSLLTIVAGLAVTRRRPGRRIHPTEVLLPAGKAGQPEDSVIMAHQVRTISKQRIRRSYGWLTDEDVRQQVRVAMRLYLDLEQDPMP